MVTKKKKISDPAWNAIIAGLFGCIMLYLQNRQAMQIEQIHSQQALKVEQVKVDLLKANAEVIRATNEADKKLTDVSIAIEKVHKATNSLTDRLVASTEKEARARGIIEGAAEEKERSK